MTKEDIILYVHDVLEENEAFRNLKRQEGVACASLVDEVVEKAKGIFLWVFLVVRSLTSGLRNADRIMDLQRRLRRFPSDLEGYYLHMLNNIDDNYQYQTAQTLLLALQAPEPLSLMTYAMVNELEIDPFYALDLRIQQMSSADIACKHSNMKLRINARCMDLLEVKPVRRKPRASRGRRDLAYDSDTSLPSFYQYQVDFLHRTVRDFLHLKEIHEWVLENVSCDFDVDQSLCAAFLAQVKTVSVQNVNLQNDRQLSLLVDGMMHHARQIESRTKTSPIQLLKSFYGVVRHHYWASEPFSDVLIGEPSHRSSLIHQEISNGSVLTSLKLLCYAPVAFSVQQDLQLHVGNKMDDRRGDLSLYRDDTQLLRSALYPYQRSTASETHPHNYNMLRLLISKGVKPHCMELDVEVRERVCRDVYGSWLKKA